MNDLKNILNYFGDFWELRSLGEVYIFTAYRGKGCFTKILADTLEDLSEQIHKIINECAIKKKPAKKKVKKCTK